MSIDKRIVEAIPPRRQWDPRIVSGIKRVNSGEDPDRVALDLAMVVPGFTRTQLGAYIAAYNRLQKKVKEGLFSSPEPDVADRDNKEQAVQALLGSEDVDVKKVPDEKLSDLIQGLGSITTESINSQVRELIAVMREQKASRNDVLEALQVHIGFNLREAKEILKEHVRESRAKSRSSAEADLDLEMFKDDPEQVDYMRKAWALSKKGYNAEDIQDELGYGVVDSAILQATFGEAKKRSPTKARSWREAAAPSTTPAAYPS